MTHGLVIHSLLASALVKVKYCSAVYFFKSASQAGIKGSLIRERIWGQVKKGYQMWWTYTGRDKRESPCFETSQRAILSWCYIEYWKISDSSALRAHSHVELVGWCWLASGPTLARKVWVNQEGKSGRRVGDRELWNANLLCIGRWLALPEEGCAAEMPLEQWILTWPFWSGTVEHTRSTLLQNY